MSDWFSLTRKSDPEAGPVSRALVDEEMCKYFGVKHDPSKFFFGWYDVVGYELTPGKTVSDAEKKFNNLWASAGKSR
jgi:hypothetical protein